MATVKFRSELKEQFKTYLEEQFKQISPTRAAMEMRKGMLVEMLDKEQELRIKGVTDNAVIYNLVVDSLGDMSARLGEFENRAIKEAEAKRNVAMSVGIGVGGAALLAVIYVVTSVFTGLWHPLWMILLAGAFLAATVIFAIIAIKCIKNKKFVVVRLLVAAAIALLSIFIFLVLQILFKVEGSYLVFLAMIPAILGVDTVIAFLVGSKIRWIELPIFVELLGVMLYVIIGLALDPILHVASIWHPGWLLCLLGVVFALVEGIVFLSIFSQKREKKQKKQKEDKYKKVDESYWTEWDD